MNTSVDNQIDFFFKRIEERLNFTLEENDVPSALNQLISREGLIQIYQSVLNNETEIRRTLDSGSAYRLKKDMRNTTRTINIIFDPLSGELELILETKNKILDSNDQTIKGNTPVFSGANKSTKPAWRIDTEVPIKMANAVYYSTNENKYKQELNSAINEGLLAMDVIADQSNPIEKQRINVTMPGTVIKEKGVRKSNKKPYVAKQSHYSPYALCDLRTLLDNPDKYPLSIESENLMARSLLDGVKLLHEKGIIHQDIKPDNILVYRNNKGDYFLALTDFGLSVKEINKKSKYASGTLGYESPEIAQAFKQDEYFKDRKFYSYGREISTQNTYQNVNSIDGTIPDKANDMWSVGMVLHQIFYKEIPRVGEVNVSLPVIKGLLEPNRNKRLTVTDAIHQFEKPASKPITFYLSTAMNNLKHYFNPEKNVSESQSNVKRRRKDK